MGEQRFGQPRLALAWEIDQDCLKVTAAKLPWLAHRGDITKDDPKKVAATIREADPNKECLVLFGAAPPCQDFSPIGSGDGRQGARGRLFSVSADFVQAIFDELSGYNTASIFENVLMNSADAKTVTEKLGYQPVFACAGDFGWVTRPRLWWLSVKSPVRRLRPGLREKGWLPPLAAQHAQEGGHRLLHGRLQLPR